MIIQICAWCQRQLDKNGNHKGARVSPLFMEWLQEAGILASHGICRQCFKDVA